MTPVTAVLIELAKQDPIAKFAIEKYEAEGYTFLIKDYKDPLDQVQWINTQIWLNGEIVIGSNGASFQDVIDLFKAQLDILR